MSTAEPLGEDQWSATGVDLETRRRRILATLTALGRPGEVEQFQRALAAATRAAADTQDYAGLEGVGVQRFLGGHPAGMTPLA